MKDRLPPHSPEAEQGVLGCVFLEPHERLPECVVQFRGDADAFYDLRHQVIFNELVAMFEARIPIDVIALQQRLKDKQILDQVGGLAYLSELQDVVPSAANLAHYIEIVREKWMLRKMIKTCTEVVSRIYEFEGDVDRLLDEAENDVMRVRQLRSAGQERTMKQAIDRALVAIDGYAERNPQFLGLPTGFKDLDDLIGGLQPADVFVLAARPSMGKTSLAMNIAEHVSIEQRAPVGVFSLEMTLDALVMRMLCTKAKVNFRNVRDGFFAERDFPQITQAAGVLSSAPIWIDDTAGLSILEMRAKARRMVQQHGVKLFVIDYLQLIKSSNRRADSRQQEIADISAGIKGMARELNVPVIVLSQLNRELDREKNRRPRLSDLRESGAIEQDADMVAMLYKKPIPDNEPEDQQRVLTNLWLGKQRNGPADEIVPLLFIKPLTRFESVVTEPEVPEVQANMFPQ